MSAKIFPGDTREMLRRSGRDSSMLDLAARIWDSSPVTTLEISAKRWVSSIIDHGMSLHL